MFIGMAYLIQLYPSSHITVYQPCGVRLKFSLINVPCLEMKKSTKTILFHFLVFLFNLSEIFILNPIPLLPLQMES
mgnify:CR=1 FL=1